MRSANSLKRWQVDENPKLWTAALQEELDAIDMVKGEKFMPKGVTIPGETIFGELNEEEKRFYLLGRQYGEELKPLTKAFEEGKFKSEKDSKAIRFVYLMSRLEILGRIFEHMFLTRLGLWDKMLSMNIMVRSGWKVVGLPMELPQEPPGDDPEPPPSFGDGPKVTFMDRNPKGWK